MTADFVESTLTMGVLGNLISFFENSVYQIDCFEFPHLAAEPYKKENRTLVRLLVIIGYRGLCGQPGTIEHYLQKKLLLRGFSSKTAVLQTIHDVSAGYACLFNNCQNNHNNHKISTPEIGNNGYVFFLR